MRDYQYRRLRDYNYQIIKFTNALDEVWYQIKQQEKDVKFLWMILKGSSDWIRTRTYIPIAKKFATCEEAQSYLDNLLEQERLNELRKQTRQEEVFCKENL